MAELTIADLNTLPRVYPSPRALWDVLIGEDAFLPIVEASSSGNITALRALLTQPQWVDIAFEKPHTIYGLDGSDPESGGPRVSAMPFLNLKRAILKAAENGHAGAISTLLSWASQHDVEPSSLTCRHVVMAAFRGSNPAVFETLASVDPRTDHEGFVNYHLSHYGQPLDRAIAWRQIDIVAVLLEHGADPRALITPKGNHKRVVLDLAARADGTRLIELLLKHGAPIAGSSALHAAAQDGLLDNMRYLVEQGADVNEQVPTDLRTKRRVDWPGWCNKYPGGTPMHFAASEGHVDAMKLLESYGARSDAPDGEGRTPAQLLEEQNKQAAA